MKQEEVIYDDRDDEKLGEVPAPAGAYMPWEKPGWDPGQDAGEDWNTALDKPQERVARIITAGKSKKPQPVFKTIPMGKSQRNLLFMNPGDDKIEEAVYWLRYGGEQPPWVNAFRNHLSVQRSVLYFDEFAMKEDKRQAVKSLFFDPKRPSTIQPSQTPCVPSSRTSANPT